MPWHALIEGEATNNAIFATGAGRPEQQGRLLRVDPSTLPGSGGGACCVRECMHGQMK